LRDRNGAQGGSQQPGFTEAIEAAACGIGGLRPENEMVGEFDVDGQRRLPQPACDLDVGRARRRIATYAVSGISGVMPRPVLCRMPRFFASELLHLDAA
jgi:hypothetical protein